MSFTDSASENRAVKASRQWKRVNKHEKEKMATKDVNGFATNDGYEPDVNIDEISLTQLAESIPSPHMYFLDRDRRIDFILVYKKNVFNNKSGAAEKIAKFQENLIKGGLHLEIDKDDWRDEVYVKIHAPFQTLARYADVLKLRMPLTKLSSGYVDNFTSCGSLMNPVSSLEDEQINHMDYKLWRWARMLAHDISGASRWLHPDQSVFLKVPHHPTWPFSRNKEYLFDIPSKKDDFFTYTERSHIVYYILRRCQYSNASYGFGISKLLQDEIFDAAFPPHDGSWKYDAPPCQRKKLYDHWAQFKNWYRAQPLDYIKEYFGPEVAIYFAFMGHYVFWLIIATIFCILALLYGVISAATDPISDDFCSNGTDVVMCPLCEYKCRFWRLKESCYYVRAARVFNNEGTIIYSAFMAFWGIFFLIYWQRSQAVLLYQWNIHDLSSEQEIPRPEYAEYMQQIEKENATRNLFMKRNIEDLNDSLKIKVEVSEKLENQRVPFWRKRVPLFCFTFSTVFFLVILAIIFLLGVIGYRLTVLTVLKAQNYFITYEFASMISIATAALINLTVILLLEAIYERLAVWLTDKEMLRTDGDYHDSLALKLFLMQFVNNYAAIFYIAFLKGNFVGHPGHQNSFLSKRLEECQLGGCMLELTVQMTIVFIGKQLAINIKELSLPLLLKLYYKLKRTAMSEKIDKNVPWASDYSLLEFSETQLFFEYMEMMIQYGFMVFFIAAFPLAPLFALINNIIEIRRDAAKFIRYYKRPVSLRVSGIGIWFGILLTTTRLSTVCSALIIGITSDFIPILVYKYGYSPDGSLKGFQNFYLAVFNTSDFPVTQIYEPNDKLANQTKTCRYRQYRNPPDHTHAYQFSPQYWEILASRLLFILVFENLLLGSTKTLRWLVPENPKSLRRSVRIETQRVTDYILRAEVVLAKVEPFLKKIRERVRQRRKRLAFKNSIVESNV